MARDYEKIALKGKVTRLQRELARLDEALACEMIRAANREGRFQQALWRLRMFPPIGDWRPEDYLNG